MLATLKEIMKIAEERNIAVGSFNTPNLEGLQAVLEAAEDLNLPVIIQFAQCHQPLVPLSLIGPVMVKAAKESKVPVCVHLDHGETLEYLQEALAIGFTSIMYEGSILSYEENLKNTKTAVAIAAKTGASVEAELGSMGKRESGSVESSAQDDSSKIYTDPHQAKIFTAQTGIDALACSFGTTHGIYLKQPKLDFEVVRQVRALTGNLPIVMHGGSGVSREDYHKAIRAGVRKINYFTYMDKAGGAAAADYIKDQNPQEPVFFSSIAVAGRAAMKENVKAAMKIFAMADE